MPPPSKTNKSIKHPNQLRKSGITNSVREFYWLTRQKPDRVGILSEGDSWFAYPRKYLFAGPNANIIDFLCSTIKNTDTANLLRMSSNGDEATNMMSDKQRHSLCKILKDRNDHIKLILFSGGGNDLVGRWDMERFLKHYQPGYSATDCIHLDRFERKIERVILSYKELCDIRDEYCPKAHIVTHTYDQATPSPRGASFLWGTIKTKEWIYRYMMEKGINNTQLQNDIVNFMLTSLQQKLKDMQNYSGNFHVVDTYGTLRPGHDDDWENEIHPTSSGFKEIYTKLHAKMKELEPSLP